MEPVCNGLLDDETAEVLGSVTHTQLHESETGDKSSSIQLRTSARVFKKLKLDSQQQQQQQQLQLQQAATAVNSNPGAVAALKKDNDDKLVNETKPRARRAHEVWSPEDKNAFFEALNEYGKDFVAIQQHIGLKAKKRGEQVIKNRTQARHFYHRTWHKISKHLRFPDGVKKATRELYGLINFGEFRKKVGFVTERNSVKLNEMIYFGSTQIRVKGKTSRIKTPICKALRKLNELEECAEEVKLPSRVIVELKPRHNEAWARVQSLAHNPRVRTELPLNRRLATLISFFQTRWRLHDDKHRDRLIASSVSNTTGGTTASNSSSVSTHTSSNTSTAQTGLTNDDHINEVKSSLPKDEWVFCVAPQPGTQRVEASFKLTAIITSDKLSLYSHAERLGTDCRYILQQLQAATKGKLKVSGVKRPRTESSSDKNITGASNLTNITATSTFNNTNNSVTTSTDSFSTGFVHNNVNNNTVLENEQIQNSSVISLFSHLQSTNGISSIHSDKSPISVNELSLQQQKIDNNQPLVLQCGDNNTDNGISSLTSLLSPVCNSSNNNNSNSNNNSNEWVSPVKDDFDTESVTASKEKTAEILERVKSGWNSSNAGTTRVGELYVMFGSNSKLLLDYWWERTSNNCNVTSNEQKQNEHQQFSIAHKITNDAITNASVSKNNTSVAPLPLASSLLSSSSTSPSLSVNDSENCSTLDHYVSKTLNKLVSIAKLSFQKVKVQCPCGHVCDSDKNNIVSKYITRRVPSKLNKPSEINNDKFAGNAVNIVQTTNVTDGGLFTSALTPFSNVQHSGQMGTALTTTVTTTLTMTAVISTPAVNNSSSTTTDVSFISKPVADAVFKRPLIAPSQPKTDNSEAFKAQLDKFRLSRYCNRRGRTTKNVVVSRILPLLPKMPPKVMVIGNAGGTNYKPIVPAPPSTVTSVTSVGSPSSISGLNNNIIQHHLQHHKAKLNIDSSNTNNIICSSGSIPVLFSHSALTPVNTITPSSQSTTFMDIDKKGVFDKVSLSPSLSTSCDTENTRGVDTKGEDQHKADNFCNVSEFSYVSNNFSELNSGQDLSKQSSKLSSISEQLSNKNISNNSSCKMFDGLLTGVDITLLNTTESVSNNNSIIDNNCSNTQNIDLLSNPPSPTRILKEESILINNDDYSLSSLLGHLESPVKEVTKNNATLSDDNSLPDLHSLMYEDSMEFMGKFADLAAHINSEANENK
ncbi:cramped chromatin regulator [Lycorma delicatula]|uniref:cramped chromatin regulator n=1 Tax=Lycorma delicatula TaxID=130591 RepID=UPI003F50ED0F